jgi:hypothetical protein
MAIGAHIVNLFRSLDAAAARTAIGAGTSSVALPATATAAEMRAATQTGTRMFSPSNFAEQSGTTAARPTDASIGYRYFDTTIGKPVFLKATPSTWVTADGVAA